MRTAGHERKLAVLTIGLDIGGSGVKAACWDGKTFTTRSSFAYTLPDAATVRAAIEAVTVGWVADRSAMAVPGVLAGDKSHLVAAVNLPGLVGVPLHDLWAVDGVTTDQVAAAVDVAATRQLRGRLLAVSIGTGVGGCVLDVSDDHPLGQILHRRR